jgi:hypothetical protein
MQAELMKGFPPAAEQQVTLANWRKPPFNKWSFQHVREIIATAEIPNDPDKVRKFGELDTLTPRSGSTTASRTRRRT